MSLTDENESILPISTTMEIDNKKIAITEGTSDDIILPIEMGTYYMQIPKVIDNPYCMIEIFSCYADRMTLYIGDEAQFSEGHSTINEPYVANFFLDPDGVEIKAIYSYRGFSI